MVFAVPAIGKLHATVQIVLRTFAQQAIAAGFLVSYRLQSLFWLVITSTHALEFFSA